MPSAGRVPADRERVNAITSAGGLAEGLASYRTKPDDCPLPKHNYGNRASNGGNPIYWCTRCGHIKPSKKR